MSAAGGAGDLAGASDVLRMTGIAKRFGGVQALRGAELTARRGEILGLCGENGAGKSTLLKVLAGVYPHGSFEGEVRVFERVARFSGTADATQAGVAVVHQELMLVSELTVAQNLLLGREPRRHGFVDDDAMEVRACALLARFGVDAEIDATAKVGTLGIGLQQVVEIVRALSQDARILVLDEPTAALTAREADRLMAWLRDLRAQGTTSLYVSHRMDEIFALCDRVTVLRDGRTEGTVVTRATTPDAVVAMMVGRDVVRATRPKGGVYTQREAAKAPLLEVSGLTLRASRGARPVLDGVTLQVSPGEIVAVCGAMGSGRTALLSTLFGGGRGEVLGAVTLGGALFRPESPREAIAAGVALVPEDRKGQGLVLGMSVAANLTLPRAATGRGLLARLGFVDEEAEEVAVRERIRELGVRGTADALTGTLSGGNQQKIVLGKWLSAPPRLLLLDEPTRGVDVGAREEIYGILETLAWKGAAVLVATSDLAEAVRLAGRVVVLRQGRVESVLVGEEISEEAIVLRSTGAARALGAPSPEPSPARSTGAPDAPPGGVTVVPVAWPDPLSPAERELRARDREAEPCRP